MDYGDMQQQATWEYATVSISMMALGDLTRTLNNAGAKGWELVSVQAVPAALSSDRLVAILKRQIVPFAPPTDREAGWHVDPSDRHERRYWDGETWTFLVSNQGVEDRDPPTKRSPAQRPQ